METEALNVTSLIDDRPIGGLQIAVIILCALVNMLDGIDTQSIGVAAPFIAEGLGIPVAQFGPIFSAALLGAALGAIGFGAVADRLGRKPLLLVALLLIGVFTLLTAHASSVKWLVVYRFLAGAGLGGATPCFIALTSEYAPARNRAACVTLMWAGFPLGAMLGAFANSFLLPAFGWRAIFYIGGLLPLIVAMILIIWLPESLKFLVNRGAFDAARRILQRMGIKTEPGTKLTTNEHKQEGLPLRQVFSEGRGLLTLLLWVPFFISFGILTVAVLWTPTLLRLNGISPAMTAFVVAFNGLGALFGQGLAGRLVERFGALRTLVPAFILGALATAGLGYGASSVAAASFFIGLNGLFLGLASGGAIALAALLYPTAVRSSGVGLGMAMGRFGQVVSPLIAGGMLGAGFNAGQIMVVIGSGALVGALFVIWFRILAARRHIATVGTEASTG
ncbi:MULTISPECIES: MFS transporter [unclassified Beijerinckia]|uniref:MFS transporter n=1 Tax=unclassified Beijerinckia TaxID=2638183 RepID=UPI000896E2F4|nr:MULTISPECIES: MFS transporter [unclassified Beijerinckia]MDH7795215.1 AAHS family 4-hydroxybenzoate transporter-like MFS transporter [Beijerinckia sp. GAS462]SEB92336.1 MFS transporter, AAHS family, 4-hydroxybenzoate transporter [Beijerinckia sp. 28-YEA-48]